MRTHLGKDLSLKKILVLLLFLALGISSLVVNVGCNANTPSGPNNFQSPLQTIAAINPTWTLTFTPSFTPTPTPAPVLSPTPYFAGTWTGFSSPSGLAVFNNVLNGGVFVADMGHNQVKKYSFNGTLITSWGDGGKGKGIVPVTSPQALAVDGNGNLYVVGASGVINKYDNLGNLNSQFTSVLFNTSSSVNLNGAVFTGPQGIGVDGSGNLYVSDTGNGRIVKLNPSGTLGSGFGTSGAVTVVPVAPATQVAPLGLAVDNNGNVAIVANDNNVHYYDSTGNLMNTYPGFNSPHGITFDSGNNLFIADTVNRQVEVFPNYALYLSPGVIFNNGGTMVTPTGVAVDSNGNIYVTDAGNGTVVKFFP